MTEPTQPTQPKAPGAEPFEIPVPTRKDVMRDFAKVARKPPPPVRPDAAERD